MQHHRNIWKFTAGHSHFRFPFRSSVSSDVGSIPCGQTDVKGWFPFRDPPLPRVSWPALKLLKTDIVLKTDLFGIRKQLGTESLISQGARVRQVICQAKVIATLQTLVWLTFIIVSLHNSWEKNIYFQLIIKAFFSPLHFIFHSPLSLTT